MAKFRNGQNRSAAVMQQRQEARDALDDFPTPPFATRAVCEWLIARGNQLENCVARDPCANRGYMVAPMQEYFAQVEASDVHDYGVGYPVDDYLFGPLQMRVDWTFINPPFRLAEQFIQRARATSACGVAMFCRSAFLEGGTRHEQLFSKTPPSAILQFCERVVIHKGRLRRKGKKYIDAKGIERRASSATAYSWLVWEPDDSSASRIGFNQPPEFHWITPCFERLERPGDYETRGDSMHLEVTPK